MQKLTSVTSSCTADLKRQETQKAPLAVSPAQVTYYFSIQFIKHLC